MRHRFLALLQPLLILLILAIPFALGFGMPTDEEGDGPMVVTGESITRIARMTSDLDQRLVGTAVVDEQGSEVLIHADATTPKRLRGQRVLVFYSGLFGQWRLMETDIRILSPRR
jgi:hypothetical protein